jgi:hypothetical protein
MLHILPNPVGLLWAKFTEILSLSCTPSLEVVADQVVWRNLLKGLHEVVWAANEVGWAH